MPITSGDWVNDQDGDGGMPSKGLLELTQAEQSAGREDAPVEL